MGGVQLILGAGHIDRVIPDADALLEAYRHNSGYRYLRYKPITPEHTLYPEDLAVTTLVSSRYSPRAFLSVQRRASEVDLASLPLVALEATTDEERSAIAKFIATIAQWEGFAASLTTKVLHKKRPALIPILDNQAIFGAYMYDAWPQKASRAESVKGKREIHTALNWIQFDITRPENETAWVRLQEIEPESSRIQLFDSVWWEYFRTREPVKKL